MAKGEDGDSMPLVLRGSLIVLKRKCGKPGCHCARGEPHETPALSSSVNGKTQILTLHDEDLPEVKAALARSKRARATLDRDTRTGLTALRKRVEHTKAQQREQALKKLRRTALLLHSYPSTAPRRPLYHGPL